MRPIHLIIALALLLLPSMAEGAKSAKRKSLPPAGINVLGQVTCEGKPVAGVTVSDGALTTKTDSLGRYQFASLKFYGCVFIVTPSGYEPTCRRGVLPQFWASLDSRKPEKVEYHDFELRRVDNRRHRIIVSADLHLANRNEDMLQFKRLYIPAVKRVAEEAKRDSLPVYSILLGDLSLTQAWYSNEFDIDDALHSLVACRYPTMLYTVMGELDYDGAIPASPLTDYRAEEMYVASCGPRFYAINIGDVHYIVLDSTIFLNEPGDGKYPTDIVGKRNFDRRISADQLAWLRRDLAEIDDKSRPVVVCMHHGAFRSNAKGVISRTFTKPEYTDSLTACFKEFTNVHFLSGHTHRRQVSKVKELPNITAHNITSVCGNNWESGFNFYPHICSDGMDAGFEVFTIDGRNISWQSRSIEHDNRTFRAYDMTAVGKYYRRDADVKNMLRDIKTRINYGNGSFRDYIYINYWGEEPGSKLEVIANGKHLKPKRINQDDPLFTIASSVVRHRNNRGKKLSLGKNSAQHMFRVKIDTTVTRVFIRATDPFGRIFEDSVIRPSRWVPTTDRRAKRR